MTSPVSDLADVGQIEALLTALKSLQALAYFDQSPEPDRSAFGLEEPTMTLRIERERGDTVGFALGARIEAPPPGYYLARVSDGLVAKVAESAKTRFDKDATDLRDKRLFRCEPDDISRIRFERAEGTGFAVALGDDGSWTVDPNDGRPVKQAVTKRTRENLMTLSAFEVVADDVATPESLATYGLDAPEIEVETWRSDGTVCGRAHGATVDADGTGEKHYVKRDGDGTVMSLPGYLYSRLNVVRDDLLGPKSKDEKADTAD
jgi:hypothetical protein